MTIKVTVRVEIDDPGAQYSAEKVWTGHGGNPLFNASLVEQGIVDSGQIVLTVVETLQGDIRNSKPDAAPRIIPRRNT